MINFSSQFSKLETLSRCLSDDYRDWSSRSKIKNESFLNARGSFVTYQKRMHERFNSALGLQFRKVKKKKKSRAQGMKRGRLEGRVEHAKLDFYETAYRSVRL